MKAEILNPCKNFEIVVKRKEKVNRENPFFLQARKITEEIIQGVTDDHVDKLEETLQINRPHEDGFGQIWTWLRMVKNNNITAQANLCLRLIQEDSSFFNLFLGSHIAEKDISWEPEKPYVTGVWDVKELINISEKRDMFDMTLKKGLNDALWDVIEAEYIIKSISKKNLR